MEQNKSLLAAALVVALVGVSPLGGRKAPVDRARLLRQHAPGLAKPRAENGGLRWRVGFGIIGHMEMRRFRLTALRVNCALLE